MSHKFQSKKITYLYLALHLNKDMKDDFQTTQNRNRKLK